MGYCRKLAMVVSGLVCFVPFVVVVAPSKAEASATLLAGIENARLEPGRAVGLSALDISLGMASLRVEKGVLIPASSGSAPTTEFVFVGDARFQMEPLDAIERQQMRTFTGREKLDVRVERAVIVVTRAAAVEALLDRPVNEAPDAETVAGAVKLFGRWKDSTVRRAANVDSALLLNSVGDGAHGGFLAAWCVSKSLGEFFFQFDPNRTEQASLRQFVALDIGDHEADRERKHIDRAKRQGRYEHLRFEDFGDWDTWISYSQRASDGSQRPGRAGFEPSHYALQAHLTGPELDLKATARIRLETQEAGRRGVSLSLYPDLEVTGVRDEQGGDLFWHRSGRRLTVILPSSPEVGSHITISVDYKGVALNKYDRGVFAMRSPIFWYPHAGTIDRATYEVELQWPRKFELLAAGEVIEEGERDGQRWQKRRLDLPSLAYSFEVGDFKIHDSQIGHVALKVGFIQTAQKVDKRVLQEVIETLEQALRVYEELFGPYPLDYLTVATVERRASQGILSFLTVAQPLLLDSRVKERTETLAHELAHQWWGNQVGWQSYRDQWLSEAIADYAAVFFSRYRLKYSRYLSDTVLEARLRLVRESESGQTVESLGPIVLGQRLNSSLSDDAYQAVVYDKGSQVLRALASQIGEDPFLSMLGSLAKAAAGHVIDTAAFLKALERMSGQDLSVFARQFIYGTGMPLVFYSHAVEPSQQADGWIVRGRMRMDLPVPRPYRVVRAEDGSWDVLADPVQRDDLDEWVVTIPYAVQFSEEDVENGMALVGSLVLDGQSRHFDLEFDKKPLTFTLDPGAEVLGLVIDEDELPKNSARLWAASLERRGKTDKALGEFTRALHIAAAEEEKTDTWWVRGETVEPLLDAWILLSLAQLKLDSGLDDEAVALIADAVKGLHRLDRPRVEFPRKLLEARIDVRHGRFERAFSALKGSLHLTFHQREEDSLADAARRNAFEGGLVGSGGAYALLAIAAHETGNEPVCRRAADEAARRLADLGPLNALH